MYNGYRIKINGNVVDNNIISRGSYSQEKTERVLEEYYDANGVLHEEVSPHKRTEITFSLRERTMKEQEALSALFISRKNVPVEYWDDVSMTYKTGLFKMEEPVFSHRNTPRGTINYDRTTIRLKEY